MKRSLFAGLLGSLFAAWLALAPVASAATPPPPAAVGILEYRNVIGEKLGLAFAASGTPTAGRGALAFYNPATGVGFVAVIDCYFQTGRQAQFSGHLVHSDLGDLKIRVIALDGGTPGKNGDMVRITRRPAENPPFQCDRPNTAVLPVVKGDLVVTKTTAAPIAPPTFGRLAPDELPGDVDL